MSFWAGVVQGVKDIDVLKEKEALADERQGVRDEENAYRDQMRIYNEKRDAKADARLAAQDVLLADQTRYNRDQDALATAERDAAVKWGKEVFWIGEGRTDASIEVDMKKWDYGVARDDAQDVLNAINRDTDNDRYDSQVERLAQLDLINEAAVVEDGRRYAAAQERLELLDIREEARISKDDDRYAIAQSRIERLDAQEVERYNTSQEQGAEALSVQRGLDILKLGGGAFASALTTGKGDVNSGDVITAGGMNSGVMGMTAELEAAGGMDNLNDSGKEWFKTVLGNPAAASGILAFAHAQREAGNDLSITELPKIIQLAGTMEAAGEDAYLDFKERFVAGNVEMKDPEQFLAGMQALMQYKPAQVVWGQVQAVDSPATKKLEFSTWQTNTTTWASVALMNMPDGTEKSELQKALANAAKTGPEHELTRGRAFVSLWEKYGRQAAEELGLDKTNPHMSPYFAIMSNNEPSGKPPEEPLVPDTAPEVPGVPETSGMAPVGAPVESQATPTPAPLSFGTEEEAKAAMEAMTPEALAQIPSIVVDGIKWVNDSYVGTPEVPSEAPVGLGGEEPEVMPSAPVSIEDLSPDDLTELEAGVEEVISAILGSAAQGDIEVLVRGLNAKFGTDVVGVAMRMAMGSNQ